MGILPDHKEASVLFIPHPTVFHEADTVGLQLFSQTFPNLLSRIKIQTAVGRSLDQQVNHLCVYRSFYDAPAEPDLANLRARAKIISHFRIPSSGHLWPRLNREILEIVRLFLWFCSIGPAKSNLNQGANSGNLFLREPEAYRL